MGKSAGIHVHDAEVSERRARETTRVGIDLCSVDEVAASIEQFGDAYLHRLFTEGELAYCAQAPAVRDERLAARFAAKEATLKVLRPPDARPPWRSIEIRRHDSGWVDVELTGSAARLADNQGITSLAVSMSHEDRYATAVVIANVDHETRPPATPTLDMVPHEPEPDEPALDDK